jgi:hypothetical protein
MISLVIGNSFKTIETMLNTFFGFLMGSFMLLGSLMVENKIAFYAALTAIFFDMIWGILASITTKRFVITKLLRKTFVKFFLYSSVFTMIMLIEHGLHNDWYLGTRLVCTFAACCEMWSTFANMLIVKPDFPFISLLRKSLAGEIANKLKLSKEDVEAEFEKTFPNDKN